MCLVRDIDVSLLTILNMALSQLAFWVVLCGAFVIGEEGSGSEKDGLYDDDIVEDDSVKEIEKEFGYFYNTEMMEKLAANLTQEYDNTEVYDDTEPFDVYDEGYYYDGYDVEKDYFEDSAELDLILDDLLDEDGLIENDLDNIDIELIKPDSDVYKSDMRRPWYHSNINLILLICFLLSSVSILLISLAWTACHCCCYGYIVE